MLSEPGRPVRAGFRSGCRLLSAVQSEYAAKICGKNSAASSATTAVPTPKRTYAALPRSGTPSPFSAAEAAWARRLVIQSAMHIRFSLCYVRIKITMVQGVFNRQTLGSGCDQEVAIGGNEGR